MTPYDERIRAEFRLVARTVRLMRQVLDKPRISKADWMAVGGFVFNVYSGVENVLKLSLRARGIATPPDSPSSHRDLLDAAQKHGLIGQALKDELDEYRAFRHFFAHGYGVMIDPKQMGDLAAKLPVVWRAFRSSITRVRA